VVNEKAGMLLKFNLYGRNKSFVIVIVGLSMIGGVFVTASSYTSQASQTALIQTEQEAEVKAEQEAKARIEQETLAKAAQEAKAKVEQEAKAKVEQEAKAKVEQEAKAKVEQEAKVKAEQEAKVKSDQKAKAISKVVATSPAVSQMVAIKGFKNPVFSNSSQVFLVTANGISTSYGIGSQYEKINGTWKKISEFAVRLGSNGMSYNRLQNSNKTPAGVLNILSAFGVAGNPGSNYAYHKVTANDYWDSNSGSPTYNRMISSNIGGDLEHLIDYQTPYKYALVTDWNNSQIPNKGAAIFIHVNGTGATGSCISLPESNMVSLMKWMNPSKNPKVLIVPNSDLENYFY